MGKGDQNTIGNWVNIPWGGGQNTLVRVDKTPWVSGSSYHGYVSKYLGYRGRYAMGMEVDMPWVGR